MNLTSPSDVRILLEEIGVKPNKVLGQNFLIDRNILNILADAADLTESDSVLEVGGGLGVVTEVLADRAGNVTVIEKDRRLAEHLQSTFEPRENVEIISADAVEFLCVGKKRRNAEEAEALMERINKVVANLPYSVGTKLMVDLIKYQSRPERIVVTVQLEVAERFVAECGTKDYGLLAIWSQLHYDAEIIKAVKNSCFWPKPDIMSGILKLTVHEGSGLTQSQETVFYALTKYAFGHRRKQMTNIMRHLPGDMRMDSDSAHALFDRLGLDILLRPQNLSVDDWKKLAVSLEEDS